MTPLKQVVRAIPVCCIENGISDICCFRGVILTSDGVLKIGEIRRSVSC